MPLSTCILRSSHFLIQQTVQLVHQLIDPPISGVDLALEDGLFMVGLFRSIKKVLFF